jgi:hypothetical protein
MRSKVIVIDNFYGDPDKVRAHALSVALQNAPQEKDSGAFPRSHFANIAMTKFPGFTSKEKLDSRRLRQNIGEVVGTDLNLDKSRFTWGGIRFITEETGKAPIIHADTAVDWAGMIYLTPGAPNSAGTGFYRHKETGLAGPPSDREARAMGFVDASDFDDKIVRRDKLDLSKWDLISYVAPAYNRLVLIRGGEQYHAPMGGCGDSPQTARMTHVFFFNEVPMAPFASYEMELHASPYQMTGT